jgi:hypothetical protein
MRAKYKVTHVYNNGQNAVLQPIRGVPAQTVYDERTKKDVVIAGGEAVPPPAENVAFFDSSHAEPGGDIRLVMMNPQNAKAFAMDQEFFVDFTPVS